MTPTAFALQVTARGANSDATVVVLDTGIHLIGRSHHCGVCLGGQGVSRIHTQLVVTAEAVELVDLNSKNGTYLNERLIAGATELRVGDDLRIGKHHLGLIRLGRAQSHTGAIDFEALESADPTASGLSSDAEPVLDQLEILAEGLKRWTADPSTFLTFRASVEALIDGSGVLYRALRAEEWARVSRLVTHACTGQRELEAKIWQAGVMRRMRPVAMARATLS